MTFENALEAMKQGKKVRRKNFSNNKIYLFIKDGKMLMHNPEFMIAIRRPSMFDTISILADDWEIYEEPLKEPEMTSEKVRQILNDVFSDIDFSSKKESDFTIFELLSALYFIIYYLHTSDAELFFKLNNVPYEHIYKVIDFADEAIRNAGRQAFGTAETSGKLEPKNTVSSEELQALKNSLRNLPVTISGHLNIE